jgi:hypothetical protein
MNSLPMPLNTQMQIADWNDYIRFWRIIYPGARTEATTTKPRKQIK